MIAANAIELRAGARILIESATFRVAPGDRIGLVGRHGAGVDLLAKDAEGGWFGWFGWSHRLDPR